MARPTRTIGPYTNGEIPRPVTVYFDDDPIDLTGFTLSVTAERIVNGVWTEYTWAGTVVWADASIGQATLDFGVGDIVHTGGDVTPHRIQLWADDGTNKLATVLILFDVYTQVGTIP